ncbi:MAG: hypothetical protein ACLT74_08305 [Christensenellales bacterium]
MTEQSLISVGTAKDDDALWDTPEDPEEYVTRMGLMQISDEAVLTGTSAKPSTRTRRWSRATARAS